MEIKISDESIGRKIASRRKEKNLTQPELAELIGISTNSVNRLERGHRSPTVEELTKICDVLEFGKFRLTNGVETVDSDKKRLIPVFDGKDITGVFTPKDRQRASMLLPGYEDADFVISMVGNSMAPRIADGDLLVVKCCQVNFGDLVAFVDQWRGFQVRWKRAVDSREVYVPENPEYRPIEGEAIKLIGKVVAAVKVVPF